MEKQAYDREGRYKKFSIDLDKVYYKRILHEIRKYAPVGARRVLDIACFDGTLVSTLSNEWEVFGVEGNQEAARRANENGVKTVYHDVEKGLPYDTNFFDSVIAGEIIEHIYDTDYFLREIKRVLKPNGVMVLTTPNMVSLTNRFKMLFGKYPRYGEYRAGRSGGHIRVYTSQVIKSQIEEHGFEILKFAGCNLPLPMHNKLMPKFLKELAVIGGDYFPNIAGQVVITARNNK